MTQLEKSLSQNVENLSHDIEKWKNKCAELENQNRYLNEQVNAFRNRIFGRQSEKTGVIFRFFVKCWGKA